MKRISSERMLMRIKCSLERSIMSCKPQEAAQGLGALVMVQKDVIAQLQRENAALKLRRRYDLK